MEKIEFINHLKKDLIPFWNNIKDNENGGFYGYVDEEGNPNPKYEKGVILNNRILWFYSNAYLLLKDKSLLEYANHAYDFLINKCFDNEYKGVFWAMDYLGNPLDTTKHTYNQAFALYALSSYYEASKNNRVLEKTMEIFHIIETKCKNEGGYLEAFNKDFTPCSNEKLSENGVMAGRTMNTLLHVLEAYTELYRVSKNEDVKSALINALKIFKEKIYNPKRKICEVFFDEDYNSLIDLESFGHEVEASWLITRAIEVLGNEELLKEYTPMIIALVDSPIERGMNKNKSLMYYEMENKVVLDKATWWVEAETVVGIFNAYSLTKKSDYFNIASNAWNAINEYMIDEKTHEWVEDYYEDERNKKMALVHPWKCPYHNGRMCIEMIKRLSNVELGELYNNETKRLYKKLKNKIIKNEFLFGHQNDTFYCVSKNTDSDVRAMVDDLPGLFGIDTLALAGFEMDPSSQENSLKKSIEICKKAYEEGCEITLSMHAPNFASKNIIYKDNKILFNKCTFEDCKMLSPSCGKDILPGGKLNKELNAYLDLTSNFLLSLQEVHIPVLFRPWHEHNGNWFYWGTPNIKEQDFISIFRYTRDYLTSKGVRNVLYVYSPNGPFETKEEYLRRYPGDDYIDILALDYYDDYLFNEEYREDFFVKLDKSCEIVYETAFDKNKVPALSEVGVRVSKTKENDDLNGLLIEGNPIRNINWFERVGEIVKANKMPYYLVWGDFEITNTYLPYFFENGKTHELVEKFNFFYSKNRNSFAKENSKK